MAGRSQPRARASGRRLAGDCGGVPAGVFSRGWRAVPPAPLVGAAWERRPRGTPGAWPLCGRAQCQQCRKRSVFRVRPPGVALLPGEERTAAGRVRAPCWAWEDSHAEDSPRGRGHLVDAAAGEPVGAHPASRRVVRASECRGPGQSSHGVVGKRGARRALQNPRGERLQLGRVPAFRCLHKEVWASRLPGSGDGVGSLERSGLWR